MFRDQREEPRQQRPAPERPTPAQQPAAQQPERQAEKQQPAQPAAAASQTNDRVQAQSDQVGKGVMRQWIRKSGSDATQGTARTGVMGLDDQQHPCRWKDTAGRHYAVLGVGGANGMLKLAQRHGGGAASRAAAAFLQRRARR